MALRLIADEVGEQEKEAHLLIRLPVTRVEMNPSRAHGMNAWRLAGHPTGTGKPCASSYGII
jgi:hypothetical protein